MTPESDTAADRDQVLAAVFDEFLEDILDGSKPGLQDAKAMWPELAEQIEESYRLAFRVAGRKIPFTPSFAGYEILRELGRGGMGTVYLARHEELGRLIALKVLPCTIGLSQTSRQRFLGEARALANLRHENIVQIHHILEQEDILAYEMEWIDGPSLTQVIDRLRRSPSLGELCRVIGTSPGSLGADSLVAYFAGVTARIARALSKVHECGLVHRDVKPSNILIRRDGTPMLADFGLVTDLDSSLTQTGAFVGTLRYASPEQLREDKGEVDPRADVYALGVTLFEAIALSPPFAGNSSIEILRKIEGGEAPRLRKISPGAPRDLETIVEKAMDPNPDGRYQTAEEMALDLERLLRLEPIRARAKTGLQRSARIIRRHQRIMFAALLGALLVASIFVPVLSEVRARARLPQQIAGLVQKARTSLLSSSTRELASNRFGISADFGGSMKSRTEDLDTALADYDEALSYGPNAALTLERDLVAAIAYARLIEPNHNSEFGLPPQTTNADFPPLTARFIKAILDPRTQPAIGHQEINLASTRDRVALGLGAFLLGASELCESAWKDLDLAELDLPLVHAGLGIIYQTDYRPERALPHLLEAIRAFPQTSFLALDLADTALSLGNAQEAERWLQRVTDDDTRSSHQYMRVQADLLLSRDEVETAIAAYEQLAKRFEFDPIPAYRLAQIDIFKGELDSAHGRLLSLSKIWPQSTRFRLTHSKLALQRNDLPTYFKQVRYAIASDYGKSQSPGSRRDLQEILRIGGLRSLHRAAQDLNRDRPSAQKTIHWPDSPVVIRPFKDVASVEAALVRISFLERSLFGHPGIRRNKRPDPILVRSLRGLTAAVVNIPETLTPLAPSSRIAALGVSLWLQTHWHDLVEIKLAQWLRSSRVSESTRSHLHLTAHGERAGDMFAGIHTAGDVNRDGHADFIAGSLNGGHDTRGYARVISGADGDDLYTFRGDMPTQFLGVAVSGGFDLNGDGHSDFAIASSGSSRLGPNTGKVTTFSGKDGSEFYSLYGLQAGDSFGCTIAPLGDINGDGHPDLAIGAMGSLGNTGYIRTVSGIDGQSLYTLDGDKATGFGCSLAGGMDLDGDGIGDILVGAFRTDHLRGGARVYSGVSGRKLFEFYGSSDHALLGSSVCFIGDLDGDGAAEFAISAPGEDVNGRPCGSVRVHAGEDGRVLAQFDGSVPKGMYGWGLCAADLNSDGYPDLVIGAASGPGVIEVMNGQWIVHQTGERRIFRFEGDVHNDRFGVILQNGGDINGDGIEDILVGVPGDGTMGSNAGSVRVISVGSPKSPKKGR